MPEFRCTRNAMYSHPCIGRDNLSARQGHYVTADSAEAARREMRKQFPEDRPNEHPDTTFTATPTTVVRTNNGDGRSAAGQALDALGVITKDKTIRDWLSINDPKALAQCDAAFVAMEGLR